MTVKRIKTMFSLIRWTVALAVSRPTDFHIALMRRMNNILLSTEQLKIISETIRRRTPCKLLIFGLGNDSLFWSRLNRGGLTVFIEDNQDWFEKITRISSAIKAFLVHYDTQRKDWKTFLENTSLLNMMLPDEIEKEKWDVILIDGPSGWKDHEPGRMKSIFLASRFIGKSGDVLVHDCDREVEDAFCNQFLGKENLKMENRAPQGFLRHYHITHDPA